MYTMRQPIKQQTKTKKIKKKSQKSEDDIWNLIKLQEQEETKIDVEREHCEDNDDESLQCIY